jgi:hypothetical protein
VCFFFFVIITLYVILFYILVPNSEQQNKNTYKSAEDRYQNGKIPSYWGPKPVISTMDIIDLPYNFGQGSSTIKYWIEQCIQLENNIIQSNNQYYNGKHKRQSLTWSIPKNMHKDNIEPIFRHYCVPIIVNDIILLHEHHDKLEHNTDHLYILYDSRNNMNISTIVKLDYKPTKSIPLHWGSKPTIQTKDLVDLPYPLIGERGSSTLKHWIESCIQLEKNIVETNHQFHNDGDESITNVSWKIPNGMNIHNVKKILEYYVHSFIETLQIIDHNSVYTEDFNIRRIRLWKKNDIIYDIKDPDGTNDYISVKVG